MPKIKPYLEINHTLGKLKPSQLQMSMKTIIHWWKDKNFDLQDFNQFMQEVAR